MADGNAGGVVADVTADLELLLSDGRVIRLAGIDPVRPTPSHPTSDSEARNTLAAWLRGRPVGLRAETAGPDRWGRTPALVFAPTEAPGATPVAADAPPLLSVALALVDAGLARARPSPVTHACWPAMLAAEASARAGGLGLWADPYYAVREASDASSMEAASGGLAIVQGRVTGIGEGRSRLFLRFGSGRNGFAASLSNRDRAMLVGQGLDKDRLVGSTLRIRGYLDTRFGSAIDLTSADQIEVVGPAERAPAARTAPAGN